MLQIYMEKCCIWLLSSFWSALFCGRKEEKSVRESGKEEENVSNSYVFLYLESVADDAHWDWWHGRQGGQQQMEPEQMTAATTANERPPPTELYRGNTGMKEEALKEFHSLAGGQ